MMSETVKVILWGKEVGRLLWDSRRKLSYFTYNPAFLQEGLDVAPFTASIHDFRSRMTIYGDTERIYQKLPSFLADSLPDDWGNQLFDFWRKEHKIPAADITPLEKLSFIGKRGMGAFEFEPEMPNHSSKAKTDIRSLVNLAQKIFVSRGEVHILPEESLNMQTLISVGTSAGGRQPKAIIAIDKVTGEITSGQIADQEGYDYYILKFGDRSRSSAELEMTYYKMARQAGITMMKSRLLQVEGSCHFLTSRFDRENGHKLHTQTLAALNPDAHSYEDLLLVCRKLNLPETVSEEIFHRLVFNVLANNTDDHNKNFAFLMHPDGHWSLSPAYDMTFIFNNGGYQPQKEHCMTIGGKLQDLTKEDLLSFASDNGIRKPESIIKEVSDAVSDFRTVASSYNVKDEWIGRVENCLKRNLSNFGGIYQSLFFSYKEEGHTIADIKLEQAEKGNIHLYATVDNRQHKYVIRKGTSVYDEIIAKGISNLSMDKVKELVRLYFIK